MQKINIIIRPFPEILAICFFRTHWASPDMRDHTQQKQHDKTEGQDYLFSFMNPEADFSKTCSFHKTI